MDQRLQENNVVEPCVTKDDFFAMCEEKMSRTTFDDVVRLIFKTFDQSGLNYLLR